MKIVDKRVIITIFITLLTLTGVFVFNNTSYALPENVPSIVSFTKSDIEDNALKVDLKSNNEGSDFSLEVLNITDAPKVTRVNLAASTTSYTFQNLEPNKKYEIMVRACYLTNKKYSCTDYSPSVRAVASKKDDSVNNNVGPTIEGNNNIKVGTTSQLKATFPNSCMGKVAEGGSCSQSIVDVTSDVSWITSDASIATISTTGLLTPLKAGEVTVTGMYKHSDGSTVSTTYKITITPENSASNSSNVDNSTNTNTNTLDSPNTDNSTNSNDNTLDSTDNQNNTTYNSSTSYIVTFDIYNGKQVSTTTVNSGNKVVKPEDPKRDGYAFAGWYTSKDYTTLYDFTKPVINNMTLYAKWTTNTYTVTFNSDGGSVVPSQTVSYKGLVTKPAVPTKNGYYFAGWYKNSTHESKFSFLTEIKNNITLYAYWTTEPRNLYEVTFVPGMNIDPFIMEIVPGGYVEIPSMEVETSNNELLKESSVSWYENQEKTILYNFDKLVTSDLVLYGKWTNKDGIEVLETPDTAVDKNIVYIVVGFILAVAGGYLIFKYVVKKRKNV